MYYTMYKTYSVLSYSISFLFEMCALLCMRVIFRAHRLYQKFFAGLSDAFQSHINILLARQTVYTSVQ